MSSVETLNELDLLDLLNEYNSELRKLSFKTEQVKQRIVELEEALAEAKKLEVKSFAADGKISGGFSLGKQKRKPYPLSDWDKAILASLKEKGKAMISSELLEELTKKAKEGNFFKNDKDTRVKLNQHLVKLANRRGDIVKAKYKGRGFAYALPEWVDERGKLIKEFSR
ncbi:MAG: hypothetical protein K9G58_04780 [Bacteroidales bacterium]|nr:hypothetical protein [Bacteroidales bacterium]MCF8397461.1 hypothetical protein [Bacteroidales bacterium]